MGTTSPYPWWGKAYQQLPLWCSRADQSWKSCRGHPSRQNSSPVALSLSLSLRSWERVWCPTGYHQNTWRDTQSLMDSTPGLSCDCIWVPLLPGESCKLILWIMSPLQRTLPPPQGAMEFQTQISTFLQWESYSAVGEMPARLKVILHRLPNYKETGVSRGACHQQHAMKCVGYISIK